MQLSDLTTLRVGGPADLIESPATPQELLDATRRAWASGEEWLVLGGGSNVVVADTGFEGTVIRTLTRGIEQAEGTLRVQAGEPWDAVVAFAVDRGLGGIEALSGIPGSSGAAPIQNIGAYGQELSDVLASVDFLDEESGEFLRIPAADLELGYRTSSLKQGRRGLVVAIELRLEPGGLSAPIAYAQLADALAVKTGTRLPIKEVRRAVLALRASKGMVLDPADPDSVSAGSFFTNPIVSQAFARDLPADAPRWPTEEDDEHAMVLPLDATVPVRVDTRERYVKLSAAWLIEHAGITRGYSLPGSNAAVSSKHTLAIVNRGGAQATQVTELARYIQTRVLTEFGVILQPEPILVGLTL